MTSTRLEREDTERMERQVDWVTLDVHLQFQRILPEIIEYRRKKWSKIYERAKI